MYGLTIRSEGDGWMARMRRFALALVLTTGCVERQLVVDTSPGGVEVFIDGREAGTIDEDGAPLIVEFDAYGTRTLVARKRGHVPVRRQVTLDPPWWQVFPLDIVTDLLWPGTITDEHHVSVELARRATPEAAEAVEARAREMADQEGRRP
jgi:hypothetical protein